MNKTEHSSIVNPAHPMSQELSEALAVLREESRAVAEREHRLAKLTRPTEEERREIAELRGVQGQKPGMLAIGSKYAERIQGADIDMPTESLGLTPIDIQPAAPTPADPSFWWARTDLSVPNFYRADFRPDGLHFTGKFTYNNGSLFGYSFGATAVFTIDTVRLPHSAFGRWRSAPHVELFGGLLGWTGPGDLFEGDSWCKVSFFRRQQVFQLLSGPPFFVQRANAVESQQVINEENRHRHVRHLMPGFQWMPPVEFGGVFPGTVICNLEVRFDVQLEGNSFLWLDPDVLLRTFQWPVFPV